MSAAAESPAPPATWLVRIAAGLAVTSAALSRLVAPGLRGNAGEGVVVFWDRAAAIAATAMCCFVLAAAVGGVYELARRQRLAPFAKMATVCGVAIVVALVLPSVGRRLPVVPTLILAIAASAVAACGAGYGLRAPHTRAVAVVLGAFALAALTRLVAWELAVVAGDHASERLYGWSRGVATIGVLIETAGQLVAAAWLGTRTRYVGQLLSTLAVGVAFLITWGAAQGVHGGADPWEAILHTALADAAGLPPPYGLSAIATFLVSSSVLFALLALAQRRQIPAVTSALALALVARGAFDAPLRGLSAVAAGVWLMLAVTDDRAIWKHVLAARAAAPQKPDADAAVAVSAETKDGAAPAPPKDEHVAAGAHDDSATSSEEVAPS